MDEYETWLATLAPRKVADGCAFDFDDVLGG
jgi:hypothetical protein